MKRRIYIFSDGEIKRKDNTLYFINLESKKKYIPVENTAELLVFGEVTLNKRLLEFLTSKQIILHFFNHYGYYVGTYYPREYYNSGFMILKQVENYIDMDKRLFLAKSFIRSAVSNMIVFLNYYNSRGKNLIGIINKIKEMSKNIEPVENIMQLMSVEGKIREKYYESFDTILNNENFNFSSRTRRPPQNRLNTLISFGNSLMYVLALSQIYHTHLDPRIGYLHYTNFRRFSLNLDISEIFKPILVDRIITTLINKKMIKSKHFEKNLNGVYLNDSGREIFVKEFEERLKKTIKHKKLKKEVSYRKLVRLELYKLEKHLMEEEKYNPFIMWW